ncbi:hypothetical protein CRG98_031839 [Punica granatum]|uniref:Uncharacterized protein n=1 Tax=Punica granatum TaxID=22663 RepID=A0A2I0IWD7_PUNGR|nr:hypothetical protein CRG98_031839 [Punica granatum]
MRTSHWPLLSAPSDVYNETLSFAEGNPTGLSVGRQFIDKTKEFTWARGPAGGDSITRVYVGPKVNVWGQGPYRSGLTCTREHIILQYEVQMPSVLSHPMMDRAQRGSA